MRAHLSRTKEPAVPLRALRRHMRAVVDMYSGRGGEGRGRGGGRGRGMKEERLHI